jgi:hypothetical protein
MDDRSLIEQDLDAMDRAWMDDCAWLNDCSAAPAVKYRSQKSSIEEIYQNPILVSVFTLIIGGSAFCIIGMSLL